MVRRLGMVTYHICCHLEAPSMAAASYWVESMPVMAERYSTVVYPTFFHRLAKTMMYGHGPRVVYQLVISPPGGPLHGGDHAVLPVDEGVEEVADHHPGEEVGEEHHGLVGLGNEFLGDLVEHDGEGHRDDDPQDDEDDVIEQGVAEHDLRVVRHEEELEVVQPYPLAVDQVADKGGVAGIDLVLLEGEDDASHGEIAQQKQPDGRRRRHGEEHQRLLVLGEAVPVGPGGGVCLWESSGHRCSPAFQMILVLTKTYIDCGVFLYILY